MKTKIKLSDHFTYSRLIHFTLPSIGILILTSIYGMVDGYFISNYVGKVAFAAVNMIIPFLMVIGGMGSMLGVGGSALVAKTLGEGDDNRAGRYFTMMIYLMVITGLFCGAIGFVVIEPVSKLFGANDSMINYCVTYGKICILFIIMLLAQYTFESYMIVAGKPHLALAGTIVAGLTNIVLDWLFIAVLKWGVKGAALATGISQCIGGLIPFVWFLSKKNKSRLHFIKTKFELYVMLKACGNGSSEMLSSVSGSLTGILYNWQLMKYAGENGVTAYGVVMYTTFIFIAIFEGFSSGSSPIISYHYGAKNHSEMKNVMKKSIIILTLSAIILTASAIILAYPIIKFFVGYDNYLVELTHHALIICVVPFLVMWVNIYTSSFFTALNDGKISAIISFLHTLVLPTFCIVLFPLLWKLNGVWYSIAGSEVLSCLASISFIFGMKRKYKY